MKKIITFLLVLTLAGAMATTAFAAQEGAAETITASAADESGPMYITTEGRGQVAVSFDGSEPVFDDESPMQTATINPSVVDTVTLGAKADEGWTFAYWINADTGEFYSADAIITVEVTGSLNLKAVFADDSLMSVTASTEGNGQIAISLDGSDPEFDDEFPKQNAGASVNVGDTIIFGAKADEGWTFTGWRYADTNKIYSDEETITIEVTETLHLIAVFEEEKDTEPVEESSKPISPAVDTPKTGDTASAIAVSAVLLSSLTAALFLAMKRRKGEQE